jgi:ATP-dependent 26S proteasome regulatory subunit
MITDFFDTIFTNYKNVTKMTIFTYFKTGNAFFDTIITTILITSFTWLLEFIYRQELDKFFYNLSFDDIKNCFCKKNMVIIEGKRSSVISAFSCTLNTSSIYSDRFKAMWCYIINNIERLKSIYSIKETHSNFQSSDDNDDRRKNVDIFMVFQAKHFELDDGIFVRSVIEQEEERNEKEKSSSRTDKITIFIYSYKHSVSFIKNYVDNITEKYLSSIKKNRLHKKFIYCLERVNIEKDEDSPLDIWREDEFESARTFNNIFFDGKKEIISKIDFFLRNKDWYYKKGIPYSLGIGLHGPPGTGKTSFIKALANYTNRHIIILSLKVIKTKRQLERFFFENTYNENNEKGDISFDKKIIVFEDIDCIGDIVLDRNKKDDKSITTIKSDSDNIKIGDVLQSICELNESGTTKLISKNNEEAITLDDILNLWDGIRETPGRILIISSNHYDKLDPALVRPGRIDITHELNNVSHNTLAEMYLNLFEKEIDKDKLETVEEFLYSPAEIINMYVANKNEEAFISRLLKNRKI